MPFLNPEYFTLSISCSIFSFFQSLRVSLIPIATIEAFVIISLIYRTEFLIQKEKVSCEDQLVRQRAVKMVDSGVLQMTRRTAHAPLSLPVGVPKNINYSEKSQIEMHGESPHAE